MKRLMIIEMIAAFCIILPCCKQSDDESPTCGREQIKTIVWNKTDVGSEPWWDESFNSYTEGNKRVFQVMRTADNVCPEKHIKLSIHGKINFPCPRYIEIRVKYDYGLFGSTVKTTTTNDTYSRNYVGQWEFGIKQSFDGVPGYFYLYYEWVIDDYMNYEVDLNYFKNVFDDAELYYDYYEF